MGCGIAEKAWKAMKTLHEFLESRLDAGTVIVTKDWGSAWINIHPDSVQLSGQFILSDLIEIVEALKKTAK